MGVRAREASHALQVNPPEQDKTNPPGPPKPLGLLVFNALVAAMAFLAGAWFYLYVDRIPIARTVTAEHVVAKPGTALMMDGLAPGPLLSINLRGGGRLRFEVEKGGAVIDPTADDLAAAPAAEPFGGASGRTILDLYKAGTGNAGVDLELRGKRRMGVELVPIPPENGRNGFLITPRGGNILAHALMIAGGDGVAGQMILMAGGRATQWDEATIAIPDGGTARVLADDPADGARRSTVIELPVFPENSPIMSGILPLSSVAVGNVSSSKFTDLLCGSAADGDKRFRPLVFPAVTAAGCRPNALSISALDPFGQASFDAAGTAFVVKDGKTEYWKGLALMIDNPLISGALKAVVVLPLLAWAGLAFKALFEALWRRSRGTAGSAAAS